MERYHIFKLGLAILFYAAYCIRPMMVNGLKIDEPIESTNNNNTNSFFNDDYVYYQGVQGKPGVDFPILAHIPRTSFNCRELQSGYYADLETDCQVFHICEDRKKISFLCPNGTIFQQSELICEWWFKVNCTNSPGLYAESAEQLHDDIVRRKESRRVKFNHGAVMRTEEQASVSASQNGRTLDVSQSQNALKRVYNVSPRNNENNNQNQINNNGNRNNGSKNKKITVSSSLGFQNQNQKKSAQIITDQQSEQLVSFNNRGATTVSVKVGAGSRGQNRRRVQKSRDGQSQNQDGFDQSNYRQSYDQLESTTPSTSLRNRENENQVRNNVEGQRSSQSYSNRQNQNLKSEGQIQNVDSQNYQVLDSQRKEQNRYQESTSYSNDQNQTPTKDAQSRQVNRQSQRTQNYFQEFNSYSNNQQPVKDQNSNFQKQQSAQNPSNNSQAPQRTNFKTEDRETKSSPAPFTLINGLNTGSSLQVKSSTNFKKSSTTPTVTFQQRNSFRVETTTTTTPIPSSATAARKSVGKLGLVKQKSTVALTRNDLVNRRLEPSESEESQIPQETASFYKNSFNRIEQNYKPSSPNPHPNHKETYEELKEPRYYTNKISSIISSVTPQYLTTQPINNGRPFVGSQVGTTYFKPDTTNSIYFTTVKPTSELFNVGKTDHTLPTVTEAGSTVRYSVPNELFNVGRTDKTIQSVAVSTLEPFTTTSQPDVSVPIQGSLNVGTGTVKVTATPLPTVQSTTTKRIIDHATVYGKFVKSSSTTPIPEILNTANSFNNGGATPKVKFLGKSLETGIRGNSITVSSTPSSTGFYVTKDADSSSSPGFYAVKNLEINQSTSLIPAGFISTTPVPVPASREVVKPRPFQLPPFADVDFKTRINADSTDSNTVEPTFPTYKISSASPFTERPTLPTPFSTSKSVAFDNVDSMINALAEMANQDYSGETPRPGLVVPPSAGPQTLHTLAVYFANALDGITADKEEGVGEESETEQPDEKLNHLEAEKKKLTELLTKMTMNRYNELFNNEDGLETTTIINTRSGIPDEDNSDLEGQHTKNPAQTPKVRQLAKVFTQALSSYLDDPTTFRKVLQEVRPTEPPALAVAVEKEESSDDELLNFSDADAKSSFPPIFPTLPSVRPTWGYLIRYNTSVDTSALDGKNSLNPEQENLQLADSQSFVSQFNKLKNEGEKSVETSTRSTTFEQNVPSDHWTASPGVTKLWKTTFAFDPARINDNFGTTESILTAVTPEQELSPPQIPPHHEIQYEVRALPKLALNSTQVHGILIDFMNTTKSDETNRLQRILKKLNTTEDEFLSKMKEIETNPLTRRLILLLISECGANATKEIQAQALPIHTLLTRTIQQQSGGEILETSSSNGGFAARQQVPDDSLKKNSNLKHYVDSRLDEESQDARALQLLNSLYSIASKFGK